MVENRGKCKLMQNEKGSHLVAVSLLVEGGEGADDGEEHRTQASEQEVKGARRGTEGSGDLMTMKIFKENCDSTDDYDKDEF